MKGLWLEPWKDVTFLSEYKKGIKWIYEEMLEEKWIESNTYLSIYMPT